MIWVVSKSVCDSSQELERRHEYIKEITETDVSDWSEQICEFQYRGLKKRYGFYICKSNKGEYGVIITAHAHELEAIFDKIVSSKRAIVVVNSCEIKKTYSNAFSALVHKKNAQSELFYAKQEKHPSGALVNYADDVGDFNFYTTLSERDLFRYRKEGLIKAIRKSFDKVVSS